jgi:hypothetical protein
MEADYARYTGRYASLAESAGLALLPTAMSMPRKQRDVALSLVISPQQNKGTIVCPLISEDHALVEAFQALFIMRGQRSSLCTLTLSPEPDSGRLLYFPGLLPGSKTCLKLAARGMHSQRQLCGPERSFRDARYEPAFSSATFSLATMAREAEAPLSLGTWIGV